MPGAWGDLLALDGLGVDAIGRRGDSLLDTWIFARDDRAVTQVWSAGRHVVRDGRHIRRDDIEAAYGQVMRKLRHDL